MQLTTLVLAASAAAVAGFVPSSARVQANGEVLKMVCEPLQTSQMHENTFGWAGLLTWLRGVSNAPTRSHVELACVAIFHLA
jgi:hypothetical protein